MDKLREYELNGLINLYKKHTTLNEKIIYLAAKEVEYYRKLKEQGKFIELPCAVGDTVYDIVRCDDGEWHIFKMKVCLICPHGDIRNGEVWNIYLEDNYNKAYRNFYDINKTVFLSREAAEAARKEMGK